MMFITNAAINIIVGWYCFQ